MIGLLLASALLFASPARADDHNAIREAVEAGRIKPLAEILATVQARFPGRVLDVELERARDGRRIYDIELIGADGRKQDVHVDAATGAILDSLARTSDATALKPLAELLRGVLARYPAAIMDVKLERGRDERDVYDVELLTAEGRTIELSVDARTGEILGDDLRRKIRIEQLKPLPDVLDSVKARYPGTVVEVELERARDGRVWYEIDIRGSDERTLEIRADAITGEVLDHDEND